MNKTRWLVVCVIVMLVACVVATKAYVEARERADVLRSELSLTEGLIEAERAQQDSLETVLDSIRERMARADSTILILDRERSRLINQARKTDARIDSIITTSFEGTDADLALAMYEQWATRPRTPVVPDQPVR